MKKVLIAALTFAPVLALAQTSPASGAKLGNVKTLLEAIGNLVNIALPIIVGIALLGFFWGLATFIFAAGDESAKEKGRRLMIWGIIALFVMVSVWGLVRFIGSALGVGEGSGTNPTEVPVPTFDTR